MGVSINLMLFSIALLSIFVISKTVYHRKNISCMTGMMIAMTLGMSVGLTIGVIFGILFSDNFFIATVLGMLVGMVTGFLAGIPVCIMAILDGLLSGLMGGMMGAMLGEMIAAEYQDPMVKIMFFLFLGILLLLIDMINQDVNKKINFFSSLFIVVIVFGFFFIVFELLDPVFLKADASIQIYLGNQECLIYL